MEILWFAGGFICGVLFVYLPFDWRVEDNKLIEEEKWQ